MELIKHQIKSRLPKLFSILSNSKQAIVNVLVENQKKTLLPKIEKFYKDDPETREVISFVKSNRVEMIPYFYVDEYKKMEIKVISDNHEGFHCVSVNGRSIYFPGQMSVDYVISSVRVALMEQDERSPHKYLPTSAIPIGGDVAVLCGASDCIYALQIMDFFKKIYLFEANPSWIKPIQKTLSNYLHKIEIVPYFVSDKDGPNAITLDSFFGRRNHEKVDYIQADIEGAELKMLQGAKQLLQNSSQLKLSLCCYHTHNQQKELTELLNAYNFQVRNSIGFLLIWMEYPLHPPYLRRGVLYVTK